MTRRGLTLVEVMVALAIGSLLFGVIADILFRGSSLMLTSQAHLEAATGAELLMERIHSDLRRVVASDAAGLGSGGPPLSLTIRGTGGATETVTYDLVPGPDPGTSLVRRNGTTLHAVKLKSLVVRPETAAAAAGYPILGYQVMLVATDSSGQKDFPLVGFTAVDAPTRKVLDPYWVPNP